MGEHSGRAQMQRFWGEHIGCEHNIKRGEDAPKAQHSTHRADSGVARKTAATGHGRRMAATNAETEAERSGRNRKAQRLSTPSAGARYLLDTI